MTQPWLRRHWFVVSLSAVAIAAGGAGVGFASWQVHQASLRQVSWDQARLSSDVLQLDQSASTLTAGGFLAEASGDLAAISRELNAEASARTAEQQAGCPEKISASRAVELDAQNVAARLERQQADMAKLRGELIGVEQNLKLVETDVTAIRSLGGQLSPEPSSAVYLGDKALAEAKQQARMLYATGRWLNRHALQLSRQAARNARCRGTRHS
jgi:hypothetical protein